MPRIQVGDLVINRRRNKYGRVYDIWLVPYGYSSKNLQEPYEISMFAQDEKSYDYYMEEVEKITQEDINIMSKLTGYKQVAEIKQECGTYYYAIYDDGRKYYPGDHVLVSGTASGKVQTIRDILEPDEVKEKMNGVNICQEVICYVDDSAYLQRVDDRKRAEKLKKEMNKIVKEMDENSKLEIYAELNPKLKTLLDEYNKITV